MFKKLIGLLAAILFFSPFGNAKIEPAKDSTIELSEEFLDSLNDEQRAYLEEKLALYQKYSESPDHTEYKFIDMDHEESFQISFTTGSLTKTKPKQQ